MTGSLLFQLVSAIALAQGATSGSQTWIADIKAKRGSLGAGEVRVEGVVVDIRSTASEARRGLYRLIDESDREGVLIRTTELPADGGAYRVRAIVAPQQPPDGSLLLEEVSREPVDPRSPIPALLALASALAIAVLAVLAVKAIRAERRYLVSPPLWLLPEAGPYGKSDPKAPESAGRPTLSYDPDLEETDRRQREALVRRRRTLIRALVLAAATLTVSGAWLMADRPADAPVPAFILIDANEQVAVAPLRSLDTVFADRPIEQRFDSLLEARPPRRDTVGPRRPPATVAVAPGRRSDTPEVNPGPLARPDLTLPPIPAPSPAPAPAPPPPPPPPAPVPPPAPPPRDPLEERRLAGEVLQGGIARVVAAINGKQTAQLLTLLPAPLARDPGRLERFLDLVREFAPRATLGTIEAMSLAEDRGEATFAVSFSWRGDFGVERRKAGRFIGVVRRQEGGWRFEGARLLDAVP